MQKIKNKTMTILIATILISTIAIQLIAFPTVDAQIKLLEKKTYAYIGAMPNPVGVGQETLIHVGITDELQIAAHGWTGLTVTVTKPDGTTETLGPFRTDSTGGTGTVYVPSMIGTYYLQTHFPAQRYNWTLYNGASVWYKASDSEKLALVVQEQPTLIHPGLPQPTEYWTRPINAQLREWSELAGHFLDPVRYAGPLLPYSKGPESAHILWAKPLATGGLMGGEPDAYSYDHGDAYEGKFQGSVVINGILYYNRYEPRGSTNIDQEVVAVDLHTGEELWVKNWNNTRLAFGQVFYWDSYNLHGGYALLWTTTTASGVTTWNAFDALTGRWVYRITNVPSGTMIRGEKGELYVLQLDLTNGWMALWNSSAIVSMEGGWNPHGNTYNATATSPTSARTAAQRAWAYNVTIPKLLPGSIQTVLPDRIIGGDVLTRTAENLISERMNKPIPLWGISLLPGQQGRILFNTTWTPPRDDLFIGFGAAGLEEGIFTLWAKETKQNYGFSINDGRYLWTTEPQPYLDIFGARINVRLGKLFNTGFAGAVFAYDAKTGSTLWRYNVTDPYNQVKEGGSNYPVLFDFFTGDGKVYLSHMEHSPATPLSRNAPYICLNATTGEEIWKIDGLRGVRWGGPNVMGDGIIGFFNSYDNRIYAIGRGPSATTVEAPMTATQLGSSIVIRGTVTDVSPGSKSSDLTLRFPHGIPAVSDASQSEWMEYVYMQKPHPTDVTGVPVAISVLDANGNYREIGSTTSDSDGFYSYNWTPDIEDKYTVYALFGGSKSYWPSHAVSAFTVGPATATPAPTATPLADIATTGIIMSTMAIGVVAIIIAIAIVGLLLLRKRP